MSVLFQGEPDNAELPWGYQQVALCLDLMATAYEQVFTPHSLVIHATFTPGNHLLKQIHHELINATKLGKLEVPGLNSFVSHNEEILYGAHYPWLFLAPRKDGNVYKFGPGGNLTAGPVSATELMKMCRSFQPLLPSQVNRYFLVVGA